MIYNTITKINKKLQNLFDDKAFDAVREAYAIPKYILINKAPPDRAKSLKEKNKEMIEFLKTLGTLIREPAQRYELARAIEEQYFIRRTQ